MKMDHETLIHTGSDTSFVSVISSPSSSLPSSAASPRCEPSFTYTPMLSQATRDFAQNVSVSQLPIHATRVCDSFDEALAQGSPISMLPNYEISPSGDECGDFLVVDLGGSTLRVAVISIAPPSQNVSRETRVSIVVSQSWTVENSCKVVDQSFFSWIGDKIAHTLAAQSVVSPSALITTGITWSFPLESTSYNTAKIFHMAKGYAVTPEIVGGELKHLLESTMRENHGLTLDVQCIINDSLAVFSAARFLDQTTSLAMVLGTGLNFCCQLVASPKISPTKLLHDEKYLLFNTETSFFGHALVPAYATSYDCNIDPRFACLPDFLPHMAVDPASNTMFQPLELLTSGRYLPELARLVMVEAMAHGELFGQQKNLTVVSQPYSGFSGELMCFVCECLDDDAVAARIEAFFSWPVRSVSHADVAVLRTLVQSIVRRAAFLVAVAIVAYVQLLARHNGAFKNDVISIGYVGSVMEYFSSLRDAVVEFVNTCDTVEELGVRVKLESINESSLVGTAIAAASQCGRAA